MHHSIHALADPFLQFHYAVLEPYGTLLRDRNPLEAWNDRLAAVFDARVRGPVFEEQARVWVRRHAAPATLGGSPDHVGRTTVVVDGTERELDVVVARAEDVVAPPSQRIVLAIGEAKAGETAGEGRLIALERARAALGANAARALLLLFAPAFTDELRAQAERRPDVELVDLQRLYRGE